ncbi:AAA family ATPase [Lederbergia wuyishanensis]|uniref:MoxR-like ATPase n=1 Tax=Lederbergia wuyishanensis TaxID=1347903 RepID=A0ABU0CZ61_9BACI|nr:MoxR family ATPase [Lederbergia wuyishanensis]MCJ8006071.1 MoxR family ATPase [Lederbergia wuyishanensis]MDQ0341440.1 MoxR-like ATPase [Lederbergia wuyishanensis]
MLTKLKQLKDEVSKILIGRETEIDLLIISLLQGGHVLLESVPGTGKTLLGKTFAKSINGVFKRIQFTPDVLPSDVSGIQYFNPKTKDFELRPGPVMTNILLADEINRATPRTQSSLLEVMEEKQVTIDGETIKIPYPFMVIATQNPVETQQGTFHLPAAQLDRFFMKLNVQYPSYEEELEMIRRFRETDPYNEVEAVLTPEDILSMSNAVRKIIVNEDIEKYILAIVRHTRDHADIELGASPRAALALIRASQGAAFLKGRDYVIPDDVMNIAQAVLAHRLHITIEASLTQTADVIFSEILQSVEVPVEANAT